MHQHFTIALAKPLMVGLVVATTALGHAAIAAPSQRLQDTQNKATRGAAAVLDGQRRTYSGPTQRLSNSMRDRAMGITSGRGRK